MPVFMNEFIYFPPERKEIMNAIFLNECITEWINDEDKVCTFASVNTVLR